MKIIQLPVPTMLLKELRKEAKSFNETNKNREGWGCVVNLGLFDGVMKIGFLEPKEMRAFQKAWNKNK